jgi:hypothetical protein
MSSTSMNSTLLGILIALAAVAVLIGVAIATRRQARAHSIDLQRRFGPEYDVAIAEYGSRARGERALAARARRVGHLKLTELSDAERERLALRWTRIQGQFVDDPIAAVAAANSLINDVMQARGYPVEAFDQRLADLSVDHASVTQHYRAARSLSASVASDKANTEDLRQAVVHYRKLFADLLEEAPPPSRRPSVAHA